MSWRSRLARRARYLFRRRDVDQEMHEEMLFHIALEADERRRAGMATGEA